MADPVKYMQEHFEDLGNLESDFRNKNLNDLVVSLLKGKSLLDIGCGVGHILYMAQKEGLDVYGAEPDEELIRISKKIYKTDLNIKPVGAMDLDVFKKKFDNITMIDVLEHIEKDVDVLKYLPDYLTKNGQLIIVVPAYQFLYGPRDEEIGHFRRYNMTNLREKLEGAGYTVDLIRHWNMIGVPVYAWLSKVLKKRTTLDMRKNKEKGSVGKALNKAIHLWVKAIENPYNLGFGLSVVAVARHRKS